MEKRIRSPNYPALSLPEAIGRAASLYRELHNHGAPREDIAKAMGFNTLNGASATAISALHKYGLIEGSGDNIKVSDRALRILHPHSPDEKAEAIREAASEPQLFNELADRFPGGLNNEGLVRNYLIRAGFAPAAVPAVMAAYRETSELVGREGAEHDSSREQTREHDDMATQQTGAAQHQQPHLPPPPVGGEDTLPFNVALTGMGLEIGARIKNESDVESLIQILQTMKPLLGTIYGQPRTTVVAPEASDHAQRVIEPSMGDAKEKEGVSFLITQAQKAQLRDRGFTDEQIRELKPEDAHRALGLVN